MERRELELELVYARTWLAEQLAMYVAGGDLRGLTPAAADENWWLKLAQHNARVRADRDFPPSPEPPSREEDDS